MRLALVLGLLSATTAFACPNLAGYYKECRNQAGDVSGSDMTVTQSTSNNVTTFTTSGRNENGEVVESELVADGKTVSETFTDEATGMTFTVDQTSTCKGSALEMIVKVSTQGQVMANVTSVYSKSGNKLVTKMIGEAYGQTHTDVISCE